MLTKMCYISEVGAVQIYVGLVDIDKCCKTSTSLTTSVSLQPRNNILKFVTSEFIPVLSNSLVKSAANAGSVDTVVIENAGSGYNNGTFLHASDTLDAYNIVVIDNPLMVYFNSTCATMGGNTDNTVDQFEFYSNQSISVSRTESLLGLPVDLLNQCDYSILVLETESTQLNNYRLSSNMLSVTNSVTIPAFDSETVNSVYGIPLSVALLPTLDGKIIVSQESGNDVLIVTGNLVALVIASIHLATRSGSCIKHAPNLFFCTFLLGQPKFKFISLYP